MQRSVGVGMAWFAASMLAFGSGGVCAASLHEAAFKGEAESVSRMLEKDPKLVNAPGKPAKAVSPMCQTC